MCSLHNNKGFTLLEILIAMVILSIGLLGMAVLTGGIMRGNTFSNELTTATTLAQDRMEDIKRAGYSGASSLTENYNEISNFPLHKRVTNVVDGPASGMRTVTVTVYWDSDAHSIVLKTILAE
ncbi:MAG: prepilin-type N-terminal cleavage/methylation domain-containing protein [Desulfobacterales bacterium]|nr:prepilin-type N-terminal cleavage/methylation domain-containing protein [Desulfobacterales bacterium]